MNFRYKSLIFLCLLISFTWAGYLLVLQIFDPFNLTEERQRRYLHHKEFIIANRGNIYDSEGKLLVSSLKYYQIDIDLGRVRSIAERNNKPEVDYFRTIARIISQNSDLLYNNVYQRLTSTKGNAVVISENIDENQLLKIRAGFAEEKLNVLIFTFSSIRRIYTQGTLAARLLGVTRGVTDSVVNLNRNTFRLEGLNGIERAYNDDLLGDYGWKKALFDGRQRTIPIPNVTTKPVTHGSSIYLTIKSDVQEILEDNLQKGLVQYGAKNAIGVIMDPNNGNIIAMAGLNENDKKYNDNQVRSLQNMPIQLMFEPGSTIKPFVSLMALEKNLVQETDIFDCRTWRINMNRSTRTIRDTNEQGFLSFRDVIVLSSNVGIARVADVIGAENLYRGYLNFGFGTATGIDLTDESSGIFSKISDWSNFSLHSLSFGQEMSVTALQLATAYSALANGGHILKPNIVDRKIDNNGNTYFKAERRVINTVSNKEAIEINNSFLFDVVETGTGTNARLQNIKIAGKTGTSEKASSAGYSANLRIASFAGFFPYENPEYVIVIVYDEPDWRYRFGSMSAVPTFKKIVEEMLILPDCNIIPELKMANQELKTMPRLIGLKIEDARKQLEAQGIDFLVFNEKNDSYVVQQLPMPGVQFASKNRVSIYCSTNLGLVTSTNSNNQSENQSQIQNKTENEVMPNLIGMPLRQAINLSKAKKINLSIEGTGHIVSQSVKPGDKVAVQQKILVVAK